MSVLEKALLDRLATVVNPVSGVLAGVRTLRSPDETNPWYIEASAIGRPGSYATDRRGETIAEMTGAGGATDQNQARGFSMIEGIERYATTVFDPNRVRIMTWREAMQLGAFGIHELPALSPTEAAHPACPIRPPEIDHSLRWIPATELDTGVDSWLPLVMTHLHVNARMPGEHCWLPISTGVAAHSTRDAAISSGLVENIERDAISLVWMHQLELGPIDSSSDPEVGRVIEMAAIGGRTITLHDATLDHAVPIVYAIDRSDRSPMRTVVSCAADLSYRAAALKALRELTSCRIALEHSWAGRKPDNPDHFIDVFDGALYMGADERTSAFDFLTESKRRSITPDWGHAVGIHGPELADRLAQHVRRQTGSSTFVTSLTTSECRHVGLEVWRVVSPGLQPLSFSPRVQFRGHPRSQSGPTRAGYQSLTEEQQNVHPQPFA